MMKLYHSTSKSKADSIKNMGIVKPSKSFNYADYVEYEVDRGTMDAPFDSLEAASRSFTFRMPVKKSFRHALHLGNGAYFYVMLSDAWKHQTGNVVVELDYDDSDKTYLDLDDDSDLDTLIRFLVKYESKVRNDTKRDADFRNKFATLIALTRAILEEETVDYELFMGFAIELLKENSSNQLDFVSRTFPVALSPSEREMRSVVVVENPKEQDFSNLNILAE